MPVIAMTREMGTPGREVAQRLADDLGLKMVLHEVVEHDLAERLHVPESVVHHRLEGGATLLERLQVGSKRLARYTAEEILEFAQKGDVLIRGWGACTLLRGVPHVARIRVCAPMEQRQKSVMERQSLKDVAEARRELERNDAAHKSAVRAAFGVERGDPLLYDLVLNTERLSVETCVRLVRDLVERPEFQETEASRAVLDDKVLEAHIRVRLAERFTAGTGVSGIVATACGGRVVLKGIAIHSTLAADASNIVAAIPGVKHVEDRIEIVRGPRGL
jgi:cytidylate kinase